MRVSLKGADEESFSKMTGTTLRSLNRQLRAIKLLEMYHIKHKVAILKDLFPKQKIRALKISNIEYESLIEYTFVIKALKDRNIPIYYEEN